MPWRPGRLAYFGVDTLRYSHHYEGWHLKDELLAVQRTLRGPHEPRNLTACPPEPSMRWGWRAKHACTTCHGEWLGEWRRGWMDCCGRRCGAHICHKAAFGQPLP